MESIEMLTNNNLENIDVEKSKLAINNLQNELKKYNSIDSTFKKVLLNTIKKNSEKIKLVSNKIKINTEFYNLFILFNNLDNEIDRKELIKKDNLYYKNFLRLKKYKLIHKSSSGFFPKNLKLVSINPNVNSFQLSDYSHIDKFNEIKSSIEKQLEIQEENILFKIYYYLRFIHLPTFSFRQLAKFESKNIYILNENQSFILFYENLLTIDENSNEKYYKIILFDKIISNVLSKFKHTENKYLFNSIKQFENSAKKQFKQDFNCSINSINLAKQNYYIFNKSPLETALINKNITSVNLSLAEINKIYPNIIDVHIMKNEQERINKALKKSNDLKKDAKDNVLFKITIYDLEELVILLRDSKNNNSQNKQIEKALTELKFFSKSGDEIHNNIFCEYLIELLNSLKNKQIRLSTFKNYVWLLNKHLFMMIDNLADIKYNEIQAIISRLERNQYKKTSKIKIQNRIRHFFKFCGTKERFNLSLEKLFYPKSLIFKEEVNYILEKIEDNFIKKYEVTRFGQILKYKLLQKKAFFLLGFYTGLRKNELRSRLLKDIYLFNNKLCIDVNKKGMTLLKLKLKTKSAKRRVEVFIDDISHKEIISDFLNSRESLDKNSKFLFLNSSKDIINIAPIDEEYIDNISKSIKNITNRYVTFHSLRHSFATYEFKKILENKTDFPYAMIQLSMMMGHETPEVTLNNYIHYDFLRLQNSI